MIEPHKLTPEEKRVRHERTQLITKKIVEGLPEGEPLDHVVLACASMIAAAIAALPHERRERAVEKITGYIVARSREIRRRVHN